MIEISDQELEKKKIKVLGKNMSYIERGEGDPIIFNMEIPHPHIFGEILFHTWRTKEDA